VLVVGGRDPSGASVAMAELYDPQAGSWSSTGSMTIPRAYHAAAGGRSFDGEVPAAVATAEVYNPYIGIWSSAGNRSVARAYHTATVLDDGRVLVCGGHSGATFYRQQLSTVEIYTP